MEFTESPSAGLGLGSTPPSPYNVHMQGDNDHGIEIRVFQGIANAGEVRSFLDSNNTSSTWACAVDLERVVSLVQVIAAAAKTFLQMNSSGGGTFRTGSARGDIYFNASHYTNINEALRCMQIGTGSKDIAVVSIGGERAYLNRVYGMIQGPEVSATSWFNEKNTSDSSDRLNDLAKFYKLAPPEMKNRDNIVDSILTKIAVKEYLK